MNIPSNLKYTKDHEWVKVDGDVATVGITDYAQDQLGDIVFVDIQTQGETLDKEEVFGAIPYGEGWMIKIKLTNPAELDELMDADAYTAIL